MTPGYPADARAPKVQYAKTYQKRKVVAVVAAGS